MRVVFVGAGNLSVRTARSLIAHGHEVVIVEADPARIESLTDALDCGFLCGDGSRPAILREADPSATDVLLCLTGNDQTNIIASLVEGDLLVGPTFALVKPPHVGVILEEGDTGPHQVGRSIIRCRTHSGEFLNSFSVVPARTVSLRQRNETTHLELCGEEVSVRLGATVHDEVGEDLRTSNALWVEVGADTRVLNVDRKPTSLDLDDPRQVYSESRHHSSLVRPKDRRPLGSGASQCLLDRALDVLDGVPGLNTHRGLSPKLRARTLTGPPLQPRHPYRAVHTGGGL